MKKILLISGPCLNLEQMKIAVSHTISMDFPLETSKCWLFPEHEMGPLDFEETLHSALVDSNIQTIIITTRYDIIEQIIIESQHDDVVDVQNYELCIYRFSTKKLNYQIHSHNFPQFFQK